jgi:hypothetical protein
MGSNLTLAIMHRKQVFWGNFRTEKNLDTPLINTCNSIFLQGFLELFAIKTAI